MKTKKTYRKEKERVDKDGRNKTCEDGKERGKVQ